MLLETALGEHRLWEEDNVIHKMSLGWLIEKVRIIKTVAFFIN
jgi:hypothetical protein